MSDPCDTGDSMNEERMEDLFFEALQKRPEERAAFLESACAGDAKFRAEVEAMLRDHAHAEELFSGESPAVADLAAEILVSQLEQPGARIGPYKLRQQLGEGGFGTVWMADQEAPVRRHVALKIIKLGMDTKDIVARFEQERQALAMMDHPNIARVFDAGMTPQGRPYFVMELVRGIRITDYCRQGNLPVAERLGLFMQVCHAVQHAHQKGIIHRDLKPSNILVTLHDSVPVPKVIDFGVAKATEQRRFTNQTIVTRFEQMIGTPAYMSPEQAEMSGLDIDTRSDIYSLGVLLYELLTGTTPFDAQALLKAGLDEVRRVIRETEPPKPSTRLFQSLQIPPAPRPHGPSAAPNLNASIDPDLDWIVMKALEKDRSRRYETASSFAADVQRHLDDEPVIARPPGRFYRFRKMVRRNKLAVATTGTIVASLSLGAGISTWMFFKEKQARERAVFAEREQARLRQRAEDQERKATGEAGKSQQVARFLKDMLSGARPWVALGRDTTLLREIADKTAERIGKDLEGQPEVASELRQILGHVYSEIGEFEKSGVVYQEALSARRKLFGNENEYVANSLSGLAGVLMKQGKLDEAETLHREALAIRIKIKGEEHPEVAVSLDRLAAVLREQKRLDESETMNRQALAMRKKLFGPEDSSVSDSLHGLAMVVQEQGKHAEAETLYREALAMNRKISGHEHPDVAATLNNLGNSLESQDKLEEAESVLWETLAMVRKFFGPDHPNVAAALSNLARVVWSQGRYVEAEALNRDALAMQRKLLGEAHPTVVASLKNLGLVLETGGKKAEAETVYREMLAVQRKLLGDDHPVVGQTLLSLGGLLRTQGKFVEAQPLLCEALIISRKAKPVDPRALELALSELAETAYRLNDYASAAPYYREALESRRARLAPDDDEVLLTTASLARVLADWAWSARCQQPGQVEAHQETPETTQRAREAERLLRDCLAVRLRGRDPDHWRTADVRSRLGGALLVAASADLSLTKDRRTELFTEAEALLIEADRVLHQDTTVEAKYLRDSLTRLVRLYEAWEKPVKAAEWRQRLEDFDKAEAGQLPNALPPNR